MSESPAFQLYAADFYMDTITWETDDIGVYFCLLMAEWVNGPLENDTRKLAKIAKKTHQKFIKNWTKISQKFVTSGTGTLVNLRLEEEREKQRQYREKQSKKGSSGAKKRWPKPIATAIATALPVLIPDDSSSSSSSISPVVLLENSIAGNGHVPHQEIIALWGEIIPEKAQPKAWPPERQELLRSRWKEDPKRQTLDYWRRLFTFVRASPFLMGEEQSQGRDPFRLTLPWLLKRANFLKVIERNYHS